MSNSKIVNKFYKLAEKSFVVNKPYKIILMPRKYGLTYALIKKAKRRKDKIIRRESK